MDLELVIGAVLSKALFDGRERLAIAPPFGGLAHILEDVLLDVFAQVEHIATLTT